jgi:Raf kinase inhibitor-like YbhB/YbcL family protein
MNRLVLCSVLLVGCGHDPHGSGAPGPAAAPTSAAPVSAVPATAATSPAAPLTVTSAAFAAMAEIPTSYTCEGADISPALAWSGAPAATRAFAVIVDDPDAPDPAAPKRTWVHWVLADLPASVTSLPEGAGTSPPAGAAVGRNDFGKTAWGGPCPPIGRHRYFFKVYALDAHVGHAGMTKAELVAAMAGHVIAQGQLVGTYQKHGA